MKNENQYILNLINKNENIKNLNYKELDWEYIIKMCNKHKLSSILYNNIKNAEFIPEHIQDILLNNYKIQKYKSKQQQNEFLNILDKLNTSDIKVILLKGMYLSNKYFDDFSERPFNDMDILIKESDANEVFRIFQENGYIQGSYNYEKKEIEKFDDNRLKGYEQELQHYGEFAKINKDDAEFLECFFVDVHHRLNTVFDNFSYDILDLFDRSIEDEINGVKVYRLGNEDILLHLCSHLYWHTLSLRDIINNKEIRLLMYYDVSLLIKNIPIDWNKLFSSAEKYNLENALYYTLYHCQLIFGDTVPQHIYKLWDQNELKSISNTIYDRWFTRDTLTPVGYWKTDFLDRIFDENRQNEALLSFYNDYINKILFEGSYFKVVDINSPERFNK